MRETMPSTPSPRQKMQGSDATPNARTSGDPQASSQRA